MPEQVRLSTETCSELDLFIEGKTQIWKTLFKTYQNLKRRPHAVDRNQRLNVLIWIDVLCLSISSRSEGSDQR